MSSLIIGWEKKMRRCGFTLANQICGSVQMMVIRRLSKAFSGHPSAGEGVEILDMVVV